LGDFSSVQSPAPLPGAPTVLKVEDVAAILKIHPETVRQKMRAGELPSFSLDNGP